MLITSFSDNRYICKLCKCAVFLNEPVLTLLGRTWIDFDASELNEWESSRVNLQLSVLNDVRFTAIFKRYQSEVCLSKFGEVDMGYQEGMDIQRIHHRVNRKQTDTFRYLHNNAVAAGYVSEVPQDYLHRVPLPVVLPEKSDGDSRFCLNGSQLKNITTAFPQSISPLESIRRIPDEHNVYFSADLTAFYYQIAVRIDQATFQCYLFDGKRFFFNSIMMGSKNGNAVAHHLLEDLLNTISLKDAYIMNYIDDILGSAVSVESLKLALFKLLNIFRVWNIQISPWKFVALASKVHFLSWRILPNFIKPGVKYRSTLRVAKSCKELDHCIHSMNFFCPSVPKLKSLLDVARDSIRSLKPLDYSRDCHDVLLKAADLLETCQVSKISHRDTLDIFTDWSTHGVGFIASVRGLPFLSTQIKNSALMGSLPAPLGELIGLALALIKVEFFVRTFPLKVHLDAAAAVNAWSNFEATARVSNYLRYVLFVLLRFDVEFVHVEGKDNPADLFSRIISTTEFASLSNLSSAFVVIDPAIQDLSPITPDETDIWLDAKYYIAAHLHSYAHFGLERTKAIRDEICPSISNHTLDAAIARCRMCLFVNSTDVRLSSSPFVWQAVPKVQWMLDTAHFGKELVIVAVDPYSRTVLCRVVPDGMASSAAVFVIGLVALYPTAKKIIVDGGSEFRWKSLLQFNLILAEIIESLNLELVVTIPHHHNGTANAEAIIRTLKSKWRAHSDQSNLPRFLENFCRSYNATPHSSTKLRPLDVLPGSIPIGPFKKVETQNIMIGERLFALKKPLPYLQYDFKRVPLGSKEIEALIDDVVVVESVSGKTVRVRRSSGELTRIPANLLRKPRRPLVGVPEVQPLELAVADAFLRNGIAQPIPSVSRLKRNFISSNATQAKRPRISSHVGGG